MKPPIVPFTQLGGRSYEHHADVPLYEPWGAHTLRQFRRRTDGMRCVAIPSATVEIGADDGPGGDARPKHLVPLDEFVIDVETVSTTAYCRFLNSIGDVDPQVLRDWFVLEPADDRHVHQLIDRVEEGWIPRPGAARKPMMLVSWYGANAYSLWAHQFDWWEYRAADSGGICFLPSEAQWEYAARGARSTAYPWGDEPVVESRMNFGRHEPGSSYVAADLPLADVNDSLGMSPFGLHHMAGNVWQWCRDWYAADFYRTAEASEPNALNLTVSGVRSERGGSFVGPAELCRSSYRRGRNPAARGRCLGFRCVGLMAFESAR
jgi:formylglycine-generating enzyme